MFFPKPSDFLFCTAETPDGAVAVFCAVTQWERSKAMDDDHLEIEELLPDYMQEEATEGTYLIEGQTVETATTELLRRGFKESLAFTMFIASAGAPTE